MCHTDILPGGRMRMALFCTKAYQQRKSWYMSPQLHGHLAWEQPLPNHTQLLGHPSCHSTPVLVVHWQQPYASTHGLLHTSRPPLQVLSGNKYGCTTILAYGRTFDATEMAHGFGKVCVWALWL